MTYTEMRYKRLAANKERNIQLRLARAARRAETLRLAKKYARLAIALLLCATLVACTTPTTTDVVYPYVDSDGKLNVDESEHVFE